MVPPRGFLLVWADNQPQQNSPSTPDLHVNFQLRAAGEAIGLFASDGVTPIDTITFGPQTSGLSEGRSPNGSPAIAFLRTPTPRAPNAGVAGAPPRATIVRGQDGTIELSFETTAGRSYQVEFKSSLDDASWLPAGPPVVAGNAPLTLTLSGPFAPGTSRFYRLVELK